MSTDATSQDPNAIFSDVLAQQMQELNRQQEEFAAQLKEHHRPVEEGVARMIGRLGGKNKPSLEVPPEMIPLVKSVIDNPNLAKVVTMLSAFPQLINPILLQLARIQQNMEVHLQSEIGSLFTAPTTSAAESTSTEATSGGAA